MYYTIITFVYRKPMVVIVIHYNDTFFRVLFPGAPNALHINMTSIILLPCLYLRPLQIANGERGEHAALKVVSRLKLLVSFGHN